MNYRDGLEEVLRDSDSNPGFDPMHLQWIISG